MQPLALRGRQLELLLEDEVQRQPVDGRHHEQQQRKLGVARDAQRGAELLRALALAEVGLEEVQDQLPGPEINVLGCALAVVGMIYYSNAGTKPPVAMEKSSSQTAVGTQKA